MKIGAVDLFCGAGGLSYGLKKSGIDVLAGLDFDERCSFAYKHNCEAAFYHKDINDITADELNSYFKNYEIRLLAGCAPCQPFSTYSQSRKSEDNRWTLLQQFQKLALEVMPEFITMENVAKLARLPIWQDFTNALEEVGYYIKWKLIKCEEYGVPQSRKRLVLIASKLGPVEFPKPTNKDCPLTVQDVIGHLPKLKAGKQNSNDPLHKSSGLSSLNLDRIKASKPGGTWRDWPENLVAKCHTKSTGKSYPSVYGRMSWNKPSPTITTQFFGFGNGRFGHPEQNRGISAREGALLQSFPENYKFTQDNKEFSLSTLGTMIGNAVPPKLGEAIGTAIIKSAKNYATFSGSKYS